MWDIQAMSSSAAATIDIEHLSQDERVELLERLWESLGAEDGIWPLTEAQRTELERRLDRVDVEGPVGVPWEDVHAELLRR